MNSTAPTHTAIQQATELLIKNLFTLYLTDGLPAHTLHGGQKVQIAYKEVRLRETNVADHRWAVQQAERAVLVNGAYQLLESKGDYRLALTLRYCEAFMCEGQALPTSAMDLETFCKLSDHDLALIEERVYLIELAAQVRYGALDDAAYRAVVAEHLANKGKVKGQGQASPQPESQVTGVAGVVAEPELGPAMLTDFIGTSAHSPAAGLGDGAAQAAA
jgi:phage FluMu protein gp41